MKNSIVRVLAVALFVSQVGAVGAAKAEGFNNIPVEYPGRTRLSVANMPADVQETPSRFSQAAQLASDTAVAAKKGLFVVAKGAQQGYLTFENGLDSVYNIYKGYTPELTDQQIAGMTGAQVDQFYQDKESFETRASWGRWAYRGVAGAISAYKMTISAINIVDELSWQVPYTLASPLVGHYPAVAIATTTKVLFMGNFGYKMAASATWSLGAFTPEIVYHTLKTPRYAYEAGKLVYESPSKAISMITDGFEAAKSKAASGLSNAAAATKPVYKAFKSAVSSVGSALTNWWTGAAA